MSLWSAVRCYSEVPVLFYEPYISSTKILCSLVDDVKAGLEKELRDLDAEIKLRKNESKKTSRLEEKVRIQRLIKDLEKKRSEKRLNLYQAQDEVDSKKETSLSNVEAMLDQKITQSKLVTFHRRII